MKNNLSLFLLILSISSTKSNLEVTSPNVLNPNEVENFNINNFVEYTLDISLIKDEKYIHFEIEGENKDNNYVLSIVEDFINQKRIQLAQSVLGNTNLIVSKEQIKDNLINIILECSDYSNCKGALKNEILQKIPLRENKPFYYYNTINNQIMKFSFNSTSEILNIWARGELEITTSLEGAEYTKYKDDNFYLVNNSDPKEMTFKVTGKQGDYINIGFVGYIQKKVERLNTTYHLSSDLVKDGYVLTSYLNKNGYNRYCYSFENFTEPDEEISASVIASDKFLEFELIYSSEHSSGYSSFPSIDEMYEIKGLETRETLCISLSENMTEAFYVFQIYSQKSIESKLNIIEPQYNGRYYSHHLRPSSKMAIISKNSQNFENILYFLHSLESYSYLYVVDCDNYPLCSLDNVNLNESISSMKIGSMNTISLKKDEKYDFSPINKYQKLFVVKCDDYAKRNCDFVSLISRDDKEINLVDTSTYLGRYTYKDQIDKYKINHLLSYTDKAIYNFEMEINVLAGEIDLLTDFPKEIEVTKNIYLNKISLLIKMNEQNVYDSLSFSIKNSENSVYTILILAEFVDNGIYFRNSYFTYGIPRLYSLSPNNLEQAYKQIICMPNYEIGLNISKTFSFNSLNCEIEIFESGDIEHIDNKLFKYGHFFHSNSVNDYFYFYKINLLNDDLSDYKNKMCHFYLSSKDNEIETSYRNYVDIIAYDNTPQQIMFNENITHVSYGYIHYKLENDIIIKYSSKQKAKYIAKIYFSSTKREKEESIIMGDGIIYLNNEEWEDICKDELFCIIKVDITLDRINFEETPRPILELTIKSLEEKKLNYIPKGEIIKDYIHYQKSQYYYAELGNNEIGYINIHFLKGSGQIVAKIVEEGKTEKNPDWKGKYVLPTKDNANLKMDTFTKKLKFSTEQYNCENKCYLIINVFSDIKAENIPMRRVYPYTILVQSYPKDFNYNLIPVIPAPLEEYIIGSLEYIKGKEIYDFYQFNFNLNSEKIIIDIYSVIQNVLINIGNKRPTINECDFNFDINHNNFFYYENVFILHKDEIIKKSPIVDLENLVITIGLYSPYLNETILKIPYSFSVRLPDESGKNVYRINSEHLSLRNPNETAHIDESLAWCYLIEYDYLSDFSSLMIYANNQEKLYSPLIIKAKYVDYEDYLFGSLNFTDFEFTNFGNEKYIYLKNGFIQNDKPKSILVLVLGQREEIIEFYTSFNTYYDSMYIDPSSPSLKFVPNNCSLSLYFSNLLPNDVNFAHLGGKGELYYEGGIHNYLERPNSYLTFVFNDENIDMREIKINEINGTYFVFYLKQYLNYYASRNDGNGDDINDNKDDSTMIIIIASVSVVVLAIIIVLIVLFVNYNKNKDLRNDISKISFEKDRESNLLLSDDIN